MGKSIISMAIFNSFLLVHQRISLFLGWWLSPGERGRHYLEAHFGASDIQSTLGSSSSEERKEEDMRKQIEERTRWLNAVARKSALMAMDGDGEIGEIGEMAMGEGYGENHSFSKIGTCKRTTAQFSYLKLFEFELQKMTALGWGLSLKLNGLQLYC